jgi:hypothetical protein
VLDHEGQCLCCFLQTLLLQAAVERMRRLMPQLQAKLSKLQGDTELAKARCQASSKLTVRLHSRHGACTVMLITSSCLHCFKAAMATALQQCSSSAIAHTFDRDGWCMQTAWNAMLLLKLALTCMPLTWALHLALLCDSNASRCCSVTSGGSRRSQHVLQQLQQLSGAIRQELQEVMDGKARQQQLSAAALTARNQQQDSARGIDQGVSAAVLHSSSSNDTPRKKAAAAAAGVQDGSNAVVLAGVSSSSTLAAWDDGSKSSAAAAAGAAAVGLQPLPSCSWVSGYVPSQAVQGTLMQLLQEAPELLLSCSSQLAAQANQALASILDEAETALLAPLGWDINAAAAGQEPSSAAKTQQQGLLIAAADVQAAAAATCPYMLPWTIPMHPQRCT